MRDRFGDIPTVRIMPGGGVRTGAASERLTRKWNWPVCWTENSADAWGVCEPAKSLIQDCSEARLGRRWSINRSPLQPLRKGISELMAEFEAESIASMKFNSGAKMRFGIRPRERSREVAQSLPAGSR
jgi:hypothetical protein